MGGSPRFSSPTRSNVHELGTNGYARILLYRSRHYGVKLIIVYSSVFITVDFTKDVVKNLLTRQSKDIGVTTSKTTGKQRGQVTAGE